MAMLYHDQGRMGMRMPMQHQQQMMVAPQPPPEQGIMPSNLKFSTAYDAATGAVGTSVTVSDPTGRDINVQLFPMAPSRVGTPVRETFARPSLQDGSRPASALSGGEYPYHGSVHLGGHQPRLLDRIQGSPNLMHFGGSAHSDRFSNCSTPPPALQRPMDDGGFARPSSRLSQASSHSHRSNAGPINYGMQGGGPRWRPYSQASHRPFSSNSNQRPFSTDNSQRPYSRNSYRSNDSGRTLGTNTNIRLVKDTYYPRYEGEQKVGTYERLPDERVRDWFTPLNSQSGTAISVTNLIAGTTLQDIYSTFMNYGTIKLIELLDEFPNPAASGDTLLSVLIVFEKRDDADRAHDQMNGVVADDQKLEVRYVEPNVIQRIHQGSTDPEKSLEPGRRASSRMPSVKEEPNSAQADEDVAMSTGSRTPAPSAGGRTPVQHGSSTPKPSSQWNGWRSKPEDVADSASESNGWSTGDSTLNDSATGDNAVDAVEWGEGGSTSDKIWTAPEAKSTNGWGSAAPAETSANGTETAVDADAEDEILLE